MNANQEKLEQQISDLQKEIKTLGEALADARKMLDEKIDNGHGNQGGEDAAAETASNLGEARS